MKRSLALFTAALGLVCTTGLAQAPAPVAPATPIRLPSTTPAPNTQALLQQLQMMRDANARLLEQQAKTLLELGTMEETSQSLKLFGKRS